MRRAQMEMMGIAIVVLLLSVIFVFVLRFSVLDRQDANPVQEFQQDALAESFLNALQKTHAQQCSNVKFSDLFKDCQEGERIACSVGGSSCTFLNNSMRGILEDTFDEWRVNYFFVATSDELGEVFDGSARSIVGPFPAAKNFSQVCPGNVKTAVQPLPSNPPLRLMLFLCDR